MSCLPVLFPRATSQADMLACLFGGAVCRWHTVSADRNEVQTCRTVTIHNGFLFRMFLTPDGWHGLLLCDILKEISAAQRPVPVGLRQRKELSL